MDDSGIFTAIAENRGGGANLVVEDRVQGRAVLVPSSFLAIIEDSCVKDGHLVLFDAKVRNATQVERLVWISVHFDALSRLVPNRWTFID
jgi:hypothetical protein